MSVRAKFKVQDIKDEGDNLKTVTLWPVYDPDPNSENGRFYRWTPGGQITLCTINPAASDQFKLGAEVYVDFHPVELEQK